MLPSNYLDKPWSSVLGKTEAEIVAHNIMLILSKTGDTWRNLPWEEYEKHRMIDGDFSDIEYIYFKQAIPYCKSAESANSFSKYWGKQNL